MSNLCFFTSKSHCVETLKNVAWPAGLASKRSSSSWKGDGGRHLSNWEDQVGARWTQEVRRCLKVRGVLLSRDLLVFKTKGEEPWQVQRTPQCSTPHMSVCSTTALRHIVNTSKIAVVGSRRMAWGWTGADLHSSVMGRGKTLLAPSAAAAQPTRIYDPSS